MAHLEFRMKNIDETKNFLLDGIKHNDLMSEKHKKACQYLNYVEHLIILASIITDCVSLQESKNISQLSRKRRRSLIK